MTLTESMVEEAALGWFQELGYAVLSGPQLAPGEPTAERDSFNDVVLVGRLRVAIRQLNPAIPEEAPEEALRKLCVPHFFRGPALYNPGFSDPSAKPDKAGNASPNPAKPDPPVQVCRRGARTLCGRPARGGVS